MKRILCIAAMLFAAAISHAQDQETYDLQKVSKRIYKDYHLMVKHAVDSVIYHDRVDILSSVVFDNVKINGDGTVEHEVKANVEDPRLNHKIVESVSKIKFPALQMYEGDGNAVPIDVTASFVIVSDVKKEWVEYRLEVKHGSLFWEEGIEPAFLESLNRFASRVFYEDDMGDFMIRVSKFMVNSELKLYDAAEVYKVWKKNHKHKLLARYDGKLLVDMNPYKYLKPEEDEGKAKTHEHEVVKPSFRGGDANAFSIWVNTQMNYPGYARDRGMTGDVKFLFGVNKHGNVNDIIITDPCHPVFDRESYRVISESPKWEPGSIDGQQVSFYYSFPTMYRLR